MKKNRNIYARKELTPPSFESQSAPTSYPSTAILPSPNSEA